MEKGHEPSRAELKIFQLELWLEPARLGLITSYHMYKYQLQQLIWNWSLQTVWCLWPLLEWFHISMIFQLLASFIIEEL
jgi:hypothetical protein